jgi:hypothetical protein
VADNDAVALIIPSEGMEIVIKGAIVSSFRNYFG